MLNPTLFLFLFYLLGFCAPLPAEAATVLYVKPTESTPCPGEPCHTLDEYAQNTSQYFVSDTTVKFLPGTHNLSQPLYVSGINNLSLITRNATKNKTVIRLSEALWFTNISNLTLLGTTLVFGYNNHTFLGFESVLHLKVSRAIFQSVSSAVTHPEVVVRNVFGSSTFEQVRFVSFLQWHKPVLLKVQYDNHEQYTQKSFLTIRDLDFSFLEGIQLIFSHSASYIHVTLENLSISHTTNGVFNISGSASAFYTVVLRNVSFEDNSNSDQADQDLVTLVDAHNVTFIDCDFSKNNRSIVLKTSHTVAFIDCEFSKNNGSIILNTSHSVNFIHCNISENYAGNLVYVFISHNITFIDSSFSNHQSHGVRLLHSRSVTFNDCSFSGNNATTVVRVVTSHNVIFMNCNFSDNSELGYTLGMVYLYDVHNMTFIDCNFSGNNNMHGIVTLYHSHNVTFISCTVNKNKATSIDIYRPYAAYGIVLIDISYNVIFANCSFYANIGTPIWSYNSNFTLSGTILFSDNTAYEGGALAFYGQSYVYISNNTNVTFLNNTAENVGGAIFVRNPLPYVTHSCFLQFLAINTSPQCSGCNCALPQSNINFINNTAKEGGNTIYGASAYAHGCSLDGIPHCRYLNSLIHSTNHLNFEPSLHSDTSVISSDPTRVCLCENGKPNCALVFNSGSNFTHYPGEEFPITAAVVGDMLGTVSGSVHAQILPQNNATLGDLQHSQQTNNHKCTELKYSLFSEPGLAVMVFTADNIPVQNYPNNSTIQGILKHITGGIVTYEVLTTPVYINVTVLPCPPGFMISDPLHSQCVCDSFLQSHNMYITCNITDQTIHRKGSVWISSEENGTRIMVSNHCPYGYCKLHDVNVNLDHPDTQCFFNHSGRLCGGCQPGLSLALGSPQCLDCSNNYHLALLIPFALAGLALVFFIKVLNLTVAMGTINGLIFYANIVQANQAVFFPTETVVGLYPIKVFIAWLNLDFGITTCFFDGLDGCWKTWLQFVFPLYLWAITILIIYLSHKFPSVARTSGNNSVPVLATLIFLSYTKLLRTTVTVLSFSFLDISDNSRVAVWSLDGNIDYFSGKHIPLFVVALAVLLFLWLPYTALLLFEQCIQEISNHWIRRWMLWLKPFLDAYFRPIRGEHYYWVGVLLVARAVLLLVFGLNSTNDPRVNLLAVITVAVLLLVQLPYDTHKIVYPIGAGKQIRFWGGSYYKKWYLSLLENSFILNLLMLAAGTWYVISAKGNQTALLYTSVGITFCQFIGIITFHGYNQLKKLWGKQKQRIGELWNVNRAEYEPIPDQPVGLGRDQCPPYQSMDQCCEPLLEDEDN